MDNLYNLLPEMLAYVVLAATAIVLAYIHMGDASYRKKAKEAHAKRACMAASIEELS